LPSSKRGRGGCGSYSVAQDPASCLAAWGQGVRRSRVTRGADSR
jgi:hypothetical protein